MLDKNIISELIKFDGGIYKVNTLKDSYNFCEKITKSHYENFPVASILLPKNKREYIYPIYTFARIADDIADEFEFSEQKLDLLNQLEKYIITQNFENPLFWALQDTIKKINLDPNLLYDLLFAFKSDSNFKILNTFDEVLDYCKYSANPIGRIILRIFEEDSELNCKLSDEICTALQLTNFWQDLSRDLKNKRIYFPKDFLNKYKLNEKDLLNLQYKKELNDLIFRLIIETEKLFYNGMTIINSIKNNRLKLELKLTILGGMKVLEYCKELKSDLIFNRPKLSKLDYISLTYNAIKWKS